jgi:hypothetical protein
LVALEFQEQHKDMCYQYKNATTLEEANVQYAAIHCWWYSSRVVNEAGLQKLESWLGFWHFHVKQWGGFM